VTSNSPFGKLATIWTFWPFVKNDGSAVSTPVGLSLGSAFGTGVIVFVSVMPALPVVIRA
jgi:hypothetical protein